MTIEQISFRDFIRGYMPADVLMLLDKKTKTKKGLFVKQEYADSVLEFLKKKEEEKIEKKKRAMFDFVGEFGDGSEVSTKSHQAIKSEKYE
ncbi:MAG: Unknown protein [uncultured Sulfurovum sp.]|uniref:Uncharacterized protein n=1 Tax=uncultured Sulfurovum sp. TaxID=269237 RepID=A0A6S6T8A0_9BACT|nr:MAG: Unknown protein [uncultured Sulfurovum sp.]